MELVELGRTGIRVSRLCFGSLTMGPLQRGLSPAAGAALLRVAFDLGVNFVDTAELYGTYPHIALAVKGIRDRVVVATKSYAHTREGMERSLENALRALGTHYVDVFLLHEQDSAQTLRGHWGAVEYLLRAREASPPTPSRRSERRRRCRSCR